MADVPPVNQKSDLENVRPKVFQIGFNRCATRTLFQFFRQNGLPSVHWDEGELAKTIFRNLEAGRSLIDGYGRFSVFTDMEFIPGNGTAPLEAFKLYRNFAEEFPDALFVLNTRDREDWVKSRINHKRGELVRWWKRIYRTRSAEEVAARWREDWDTHHRQVKEFFANGPYRLVVFDIGRDSPETLVRALPEVALDASKYRHHGKGGAGPGKGAAPQPSAAPAENDATAPAVAIASAARPSDVMPEPELIEKYLAPATSGRMIQIGANEGVHEFAKVGGKDFVFGFLRQHPQWSAVLVEPIPETFAKLKANYRDHPNEITFLNCAVTEQVEDRVLTVSGRDGRKSSLLQPPSGGQEIAVPCIDYRLLCRLAGWDRVDFVKIDAEGYDVNIILSILACEQPSLIPNIILWEKVEARAEECERALTERGYRIFRTGLSKKGLYMDCVAIRTDSQSS